MKLNKTINNFFSSDSTMLHYFAGMKSGQIGDHQLSSSGSFGNQSHNTHRQARLDGQDGAGAWSPSDHDQSSLFFIIFVNTKKKTEALKN